MRRPSSPTGSPGTPTSDRGPNPDARLDHDRIRAPARPRSRTPAAAGRAPRARPGEAAAPPGAPGRRAGRAGPAPPAATAAPPRGPPPRRRPPRDPRWRSRPPPAPPAPALLPARRPCGPASRRRAGPRNAAWWSGASGSRSASPPPLRRAGARAARRAADRSRRRCALALVPAASPRAPPGARRVPASRWLARARRRQPARSRPAANDLTARPRPIRRWRCPRYRPGPSACAWRRARGR